MNNLYPQIKNKSFTESYEYFYSKLSTCRFASIFIFKRKYTKCTNLSNETKQITHRALRTKCCLSMKGDMCLNEKYLFML